MFVLVHAGQKVKKYAYGYVAETISDTIIIPPPDKLECGGIVGVTTIIDYIESLSDSSWHVLGLYDFILRESKPLPFMPLGEKLNFFKVDYSLETK